MRCKLAIVFLLLAPLLLAAPSVRGDEQPGAEAAKSMIADARGAIERAESAGVKGAKLKALKSALAQAEAALESGSFNKARTLARTTAGDAEDARHELVAPRRISFSVSVDDKEGTRFAVDQGTIEVRAAGTTTHVHDGQAVEVAPDKPPQPVKLLPGPSPQKPADGDTLYERSRLRWNTVSGAKTFSVDIARDPDFHRRVALGKTSNTWFQIPNLENGTYWWRVRAIEENGRVGLASDSRRFDFAAGEIPPHVKVGDPVWGDN